MLLQGMLQRQRHEHSSERSRGEGAAQQMEHGRRGWRRKMRECQGVSPWTGWTRL